MKQGEADHGREAEKRDTRREKEDKRSVKDNRCLHAVW